MTLIELILSALLIGLFLLIFGDITAKKSRKNSPLYNSNFMDSPPNYFN